LFIDPKIQFPMLKVAWFLLKKQLGFKALMEVIFQDASLVKGSHGRIPEDPLDWPVLIAPAGAALPAQIASTDVYRTDRKGLLSRSEVEAEPWPDKGGHTPMSVRALALVLGAAAFAAPFPSHTIIRRKRFPCSRRRTR
jgi:hypothetical protein